MSNTSLLELLNTNAQQAFTSAGYPNATANVQPSGRPEHGDYQINGVMSAAKVAKVNPRLLAQQVVENLRMDGVVSSIGIAGPGFINLTIAPAYLSHYLDASLERGDLGLARVTPEMRQRVVIDYSSPNLAKEMHVGHLRSTIIGDALARAFRFAGHEVIAQNHVGDWGTQFGMLTAYLDDVAESGTGLDLADLEGFYRSAKKRFDDDPSFADKARDYVVKLQGGHPHVGASWKRFLDISLHHCEEIYRTLGVGLTRGDVYGESSYNDDLPIIVADLKARGLSTTSEGAQVVFLEEFANSKGEAPAYIIQKQDGGYLYSTTDLAAMRYRINELKAGRILYVVDARQQLHFQQLFVLSRLAGYCTANVRLEHVGFGVVLGDDGKPFKTRSGDTVKLSDLLAEAKVRAFDVVTGKNPDLSEKERHAIAKAVGIGAIKYFDLSKNRNTDYVFDWDSMLSFEGNTAPYLQYAYARIRSVLRRAGEWDQRAAIVVDAAAEQKLALHLVRFSDAVHTMLREAMPSCVPYSRMLV